MFKFSKNNASNSDDGLSKQQVTTLMRHISTVTSICMVPPPQREDFDKGKKEFRRSMRERENVDFVKIHKQRLLKQQSEDEQEENDEDVAVENNNPESVDGSCCSHIRRFSKMLDSPSSILDYKNLIKSISTQLFSKSNASNNLVAVPNKQNLNSKQNVDEDDKTMNFVLTQKFIGWKV